MHIPPMPPRDNRPAGERCEVTLRDTFAAAALTGLLAQGDDGSFSEESYVRAAYRWADAMLRERLRNGAASGCETVQPATNHDAAPAAIACVGRPRTDKADLPTRAGTGDTPVTEPMPALSSGSGSVTPVPYSRTDEKRVNWPTDRADRIAALEKLSALDQELELKHGIAGNPMIKAQQRKAAKTDTTQPRNGAPAQGSVQGDGSVRDSRNANEPAAWAVMPRNCDYCVTLSTRREAAQKAAERKVEVGEYATMDDIAVVPLYRSPQPTLTDAEREAVEGAILHMESRGVWAWPATLRGLLERMK